MYIGYVGYVITILFLTGSLILLTDMKAYKNANLKKEQKASLYLGWINLSLGALIMLTNWIFILFKW